MLCSRCNEVIKPVVAVDIDGTLGDFHSHFINFLEQYLGWDEPEPLLSRPNMYSGDCLMHDWAQNRYHISYEIWKDIKLAYRQGAQKRSMPCYEGAAELIQRLHEADVEVWITTTRPYMRLDNIDPDTRFWLARNGIVYHYMLYDERKYRELRDRVGDRVVGVLEDLSDQIDRAATLWGKRVVIQRKTPWNAGDDWGGWAVAGDLWSAADQLMERVNAFDPVGYT
jgi:hypothetical protein